MADRQAARATLGKWFTFCCVLAVFVFAQPYDFSYPNRLLNRHEEIENVQLAVDNLQAGSTARQASLAVLAFGAAASILQAGARRLSLRSPLGLLLVLFYGWALISLAWSDAPAQTARRLVILTSLGLGALAFAERYGRGQVLEFAFLSTWVTLLGGGVCEMVLGTLQPQSEGYRFAGELNPVYQAYNAGLLCLSSLAIAGRRPRWRVFYLAVAVVAIGAAVLTRSRGPTVAALLGAALFLRLMRSRGGKGRLRLGAAFLGCALLCLFWMSVGGRMAELAERLLLLGREDSSVATLTGRVPLWEVCLAYAAARPIGGYGYEAFWTVPRYESIAAQTGFLVPDVHNGTIDLLLGVGFVGLAMFLAIVSVALWRAMRVESRRDGAFVAAVLVWYAVNMQLLSVQLAPYLPTFVVMALIVQSGFVKGGETARERRAAGNGQSQWESQ